MLFSSWGKQKKSKKWWIVLKYSLNWDCHHSKSKISNYHQLIFTISYRPKDDIDCSYLNKWPNENDKWRTLQKLRAMLTFKAMLPFSQRITKVCVIIVDGSILCIFCINLVSKLVKDWNDLHIYVKIKRHIY